MSVQRASIFPHIFPEDDVVFPLLHLFSQLVFLRPVEDDLPVVDTPLVQVLENQPKGQGASIRYISPAPLGQDRDRFLALLRDIRLRPEDYAGHLSHLSAGAAPVGQEDEREHSIIDTLLRQTGIRSRREKHTPEAKKGQVKNGSQHRLWQARMLLKLGESVDMQQTEIRNNLVRMSQQQGEVLRVLRRVGGEKKKEEDLDFGLPTGIPDEEIPLEQQRLRLKAWSRLFTLSEADFENTVFISPYSEAVEACIEQYQYDFSCTVKPLITLLLPVISPEFFVEQNNVFTRRDNFQEETSVLLNAIRMFFDDPAGAHHAGKIEQEWNDLLNNHYPVADHGRCVLTLYFLPEIFPQKFFMEFFAHQNQISGEKNKGLQGAGTGMVLGVLNK